MSNICSNPECGKKYDLTDKDADASTCSFECWEKMNCSIPEKGEAVEITLD